MLINIKTRHFYSCINHQEHLFPRTLITRSFRPGNITKFLRTAFLQNISRSSRLQMLFKIGVVKSFANFTGKHLCWSHFLKNLQAEDLQLYLKSTPAQMFSCEVCKIFAKFLRKPFYTEHLRWLRLYFFKTVIQQTFRNLVRRIINFFSSTPRLMYKKLNSFVYKFVVNCQVF